MLWYASHATSASPARAPSTIAIARSAGWNPCHTRTPSAAPAAIAAATDYAIFAVAGYHEARRAGIPSDEAAVAASTRVGRIIVASALTIAVASGAMIFCKVGIFVTAGLPTTISIIVTCLIALTLPPALLRYLGEKYGELYDL